MSKSNKKTPHKPIIKTIKDVNSYILKKTYNLNLSLTFYTLTICQK